MSAPERAHLVVVLAKRKQVIPIEPERRLLADAFSARKTRKSQGLEQHRRDCLHAKLTSPRLRCVFCDENPNSFGHERRHSISDLSRA
jgi:hypothetical protein